MNTKALFIVILQAFLVTIVTARTITIDGLTFGDKDNLVVVGLSVPPEKLETVKPQINKVLDECINKNLHPFSWQAKAPAGVSFILLVSGSLEKIHKSIEEHHNGANPVWFWDGISTEKPLLLQILMNEHGDGDIRLVQQNQVVGYIPCKSSPIQKQLEEGSWSISSKESENEEGEKGKRSKKWDVWMPWAIGIENPVDGCYIHGGSLIKQSDGCIHIPRPAAGILYRLVKKGSKVRIVHLPLLSSTNL